jgi:hypothetical protein
MFGGSDEERSERASAMFGGRVQSVERRVVSAFGSEFQRVRVSTLPGPVDVLVEPSSAAGVAREGAIAWVQGWLVGRPVDAPPQHERLVRPSERRDWWSRMLRKRSQ